MKAMLVIDIDEKYIGSFGTDIQFINRKYNCKWKLKPMPERKPTDFLNYWFNQGWNALHDELVGDEDE